MLEIIHIHTDHEHYPFVEKLLVSAFPKEERRDTPSQRENTDTNDKFHCGLITDDGEPIGLITYWNFKQFIYIEHFAIDDKLCGKGYGTEALKLTVEHLALPVVLEVEIPVKVNDEAFRRIEFYKRQGFSLRKTVYRQPPYRKHEEWLPMKLMTYGKLPPTIGVRNTIYREVYGVKP